MKLPAMVERKTSVACGVLGLEGTGSSELLCSVGLKTAPSPGFAHSRPITGYLSLPLLLTSKQQNYFPLLEGFLTPQARRTGGKRVAYPQEINFCCCCFLFRVAKSHCLYRMVRRVHAQATRGVSEEGSATSIFRGILIGAKVQIINNKFSLGICRVHFFLVHLAVLIGFSSSISTKMGLDHRGKGHDSC